MKRKTTMLFTLFVLAGMLGVVEVTAQGPTPGARLPGSSPFTYQGQLKSGGTPFTGTCDFQFGLYNASTLGTQIGITQTSSSVSVSSGLFTAQVDFGPGAFDGSGRWMAIAARCPAGGSSYTPLDPRQQLTAAPMALYASNAQSASYVTGAFSGDMTGTQSSTTVGALQGRPIASTAPSAGQVLAWNGSQWAPGSAAVNYQNVIVVAKSGGSYTSVQAALDSITTASDGNRFLIKVMPGTYYEQVTMKPFVDIEGSGENTTKITYTGEDLGVSGTLSGTNNSELRFLTVENTGGGHNDALAIFISGTSPHLTHVTALSSGAQLNYTIYLQNASPILSDVTATGSNGTYAAGIWNNGGGSPKMMNVAASASGGSSSNTGIRDYNSTATMMNVVARATGGVFAYGADITLGTPDLINVTATASSAGTNYGLRNFASSPTVQNSSFSASGGTTNYGIYNTGSGSTSTLKVNNSKVTGSTSTINNVDSLYVVYVGASQLSGGSVNFGGGAIYCAGVYDENYTFYASACP